MLTNTSRNVVCLVVLVGPPGSGKSTWARRNGRGAVHVSQDDLIDAITPHGFEHTYRPIYHEAEDAIARAALRAGYTVIVDRTNRTRSHRERWLRIAAEASCPAVAVIMNTSEAVCRKQNADRGESRRLTEERMDRMFAALEPLRPDEGFAHVYAADGITLNRIIEELAAKEHFSHEHCHQAR